MLDLSDTIIDERLLDLHFACDTGACKGACCTFPGGSGPPVQESELDALRRAWEVVGGEVPAEHRDIVRRFGLFERDRGTVHVRCYNDRACVFVRYDGTTAKCAIQDAWQAGRFDWIKPISCHLFPIRVTHGARTVLRYEEFSECAPAIERGGHSRTALVDFLQEPLERAFGHQFARSLSDEAAARARQREKGR